MTVVSLPGLTLTVTLPVVTVSTALNTMESLETLITKVELAGTVTV